MVFLVTQKGSFIVKRSGFTNGVGGGGLIKKCSKIPGTYSVMVFGSKKQIDCERFKGATRATPISQCFVDMDEK